MGTFSDTLAFDTDSGTGDGDSIENVPQELRAFADLDDGANHAEELAQLLNFLAHHWDTENLGEYLYHDGSGNDDRDDTLSTEAIEATEKIIDANGTSHSGELADASSPVFPVGAPDNPTEGDAWIKE